MKIPEKLMGGALGEVSRVLESIHARLELSNENEEKIIELLERIYTEIEDRNNNPL